MADFTPVLRMIVTSDIHIQKDDYQINVTEKA